MCSPPPARFLLLQNRQGKTRLSKWYVQPSSEAERLRLESEIHRMVVSRDRKHTNFIEARAVARSPPRVCALSASRAPPLSSEQFQSFKLIYRRYAGLFFTIGVDVSDNELVYLETIHLFVELLDSYFSNVCELDIVFNFNKVYAILDEYILAGEMQETSKKQILERIRELEKLE